jgi:AraC-like DNA-binding protein
MTAGHRLEMAHAQLTQQIHNHGLRAKFDRQSNGCYVESWRLGAVNLTRAKLDAVELTSSRASLNSGKSDFVYLKTVSAGAVIVEAAGQTQRFDEGSVIGFDPAEPYNERFPQATSLTILRIPKLQLERRGWAASWNIATALDVRNPDTKAVHRMVENIGEQCVGTSPLMHELLGRQLLGLMELVMATADASEHRPAAEIIVLQARQFIEDNLAYEGLGAEKVASAVKVSPKHLEKLFAERGTPLMRHVWQRRLDQAEKLLISGSMAHCSIQEIGWRCGFATAAHFSRTFKQRFGVPPGQLRTALLKIGV